MKNLAVLASGAGTNAQNLVEYFKNADKARVKLILSNSDSAKVLEKANILGVDTNVFSRESFYNDRIVLDILKKYEIDYVILAGFLWLVPDYIINAFPNKVINIHPALLPKYGGKGMYGDFVHKAVVENGEKKSGITIHYVNNEYDSGSIIFQAECSVDESDTPETLAKKIHLLEYQHFPRVVESVISL